MLDMVAWCVAVALVVAGVAADAYLAWMFGTDWRRGRAERRAERRRSAGRRHPKAPMTAHPRRGMTTLAALAVMGVGAGAASAQQAADQAPAASPAVSAPAGFQPSSEPNTDARIGSAISMQINIDFTNAYFYRGIVQQDNGLIVQPAARLTTRLVENDTFKLDGFVGTWNSAGPNAGSRTDDLVQFWYESDVYAGLAATSGELSLTTSYTFLASPSDAFETVQELGCTLALDDSEWLKAWSLKPSAMIAIETGADASDGADSETGVYMELGIAPGFAFDACATPVTLTLPASIGLSLSDYYQNAAGEDDTFGFAQVGAKASIPLGEPGRFGVWTLNAGVSLMVLGDHTRVYNGGDDTEIIGAVGLQWNF